MHQVHLKESPMSICQTPLFRTQDKYQYFLEYYWILRFIQIQLGSFC